MTPETKQYIEDEVSEYRFHIYEAHKILGKLIDTVPDLKTPDTMAIWLILGGLRDDLEKINTAFWNISEAEK